MWLSPFLDSLKSRVWYQGRSATCRERPLILESLEERLVLSGDVSMDVPPGTIHTRPPPLLGTSVLGLWVSWIDPSFLGGARTRLPGGSCGDGGSRPYGSQSDAPGDLGLPPSTGLALNPPVQSGTPLPQPPVGSEAWQTVFASFTPAGNDGGLAPGKSDAFFQQWQGGFGSV